MQNVEDSENQATKDGEKNALSGKN